MNPASGRGRALGGTDERTASRPLRSQAASVERRPAGETIVVGLFAWQSFEQGHRVLGAAMAAWALGLTAIVLVIVRVTEARLARTVLL